MYFRWEKGPSGPFFGACGAEKGGAPAARPLHFPFWGACGAPFSSFFLLVGLRRTIPFPLFFCRFRSVSVHFNFVWDLKLRCEAGVVGGSPNFTYLRCI